MTPAQSYMMKASQLIGSVQERNVYLKDQVGNLIYEYVNVLVGDQFAPKITGMLIELPVPQIRQYMQSYDALTQRVYEAQQLLISQAK
jgi:Poly-adenylate binding protein, unique domain